MSEEHTAGETTATVIEKEEEEEEENDNVDDEDPAEHEVVVEGEEAAAVEPTVTAEADEKMAVAATTGEGNQQAEIDDGLVNNESHPEHQEEEEGNVAPAVVPTSSSTAAADNEEVRPPPATDVVGESAGEGQKQEGERRGDWIPLNPTTAATAVDNNNKEVTVNDCGSRGDAEPQPPLPATDDNDGNAEETKPVEEPSPVDDTKQQPPADDDDDAPLEPIKVTEDGVAPVETSTDPSEEPQPPIDSSPVDETKQQQTPTNDSLLVEPVKELLAADEEVAPLVEPPANSVAEELQRISKGSPAVVEKASGVKSAANFLRELQLPKGLPPINEQQQQEEEEPARDIVSVESDDDVEIIEEIILDDSEHDDIIEEEEIADSDHDRVFVEGEEEDDGTNGGKIIVDATAFRAAAKNITELLTQNFTTMEMSVATKIIQDKHKTVNVVYKHFPGSLSCHTIFDKVKSALKRHGYNNNNSPSNNILFAHSICPDEQDGRHNNINLTKLFENYFGGSPGISLGGLAGIPFAGKSGFASFAHNVPENGHGFVFLAPHIGLDSENELGKCNSTTLDSFPYCCRAAENALHYCCSARPIPDLNEHPEEYQMNYLIQYLNRRKDMLTDEEGENTKQADLAKTIHAITKNFLDKIVNPLFLGGPNSTLLIFTGIQINMPEPFHDFFQPRHFYILKKNGKKVDLFKETFVAGKTQDVPAAPASAAPSTAPAPAGKQKFCTSCGVKNRHEAKFCGDCGHKF